MVAANFLKILVRTLVMIFILIIIIIMMKIKGSTMSGHFIVRFVVRVREAGEVLPRIGRTHVFTPLVTANSFSS